MRYLPSAFLPFSWPASISSAWRPRVRPGARWRWEFARSRAQGAAIVGDTVTCSGAGLPASQLTTIKLTYQVTAGSPSTHELTVKADSGDVVTESPAGGIAVELRGIAGRVGERREPAGTCEDAGDAIDERSSW